VLGRRADVGVLEVPNTPKVAIFDTTLAGRGPTLKVSQRREPLFSLDRAQDLRTREYGVVV
jgi:hypothetical protein